MKLKKSANIFFLVFLTTPLTHSMEAPKPERKEVPSLLFTAAMHLAKNNKNVTVQQVGDENLVRLIEGTKATFNSKILSGTEKQFMLDLLYNPNIDISSYLPKIRKRFLKFGNSKQAILNNLLTVAVENNDPHSVKIALYLGAQVDIRNDFNQTPLVKAVFSNYGNYIEGAKVLVNSDLDINSQDPLNAFTIATENGYREIALLLITKGFNVNEKFNRLVTAFLHTQIGGYFDNVAKIFIKNIELNKIKISKSRALRAFIKRGSLNGISQTLLSLGANADRAFMIAVKSRNRDGIKMLLSAGANPNFEEALEIAKKGKDEEIIELLLSAKIKSSTKKPNNAKSNNSCCLN